MSTEENNCLICFEENNDTILKCCNKGVHGCCIKQWWNSNNINIEDATCPHCRQRVILEKINPLVTNDNINENSNVSPYINYNFFSSNSQVHPMSVIRYDSNYNLSDTDIELINSNLNNQVPDNPFLHDISEEQVNCNLKNIACFLLCLILIVTFFSLLLMFI